MEGKFDHREPESELNAEKRLRTAVDVSVAFFLEKIEEFKKQLADDKTSVRKNLESHNILFIGLGERNLDSERQYLHMAERGDFFNQVKSDEPDSIYSRLKRNLDIFPQDIAALKEEKGNSDDPEVQEFRDEEEKIKLVIEAIESTDEFKESEKNRGNLTK